MVTAGAGRAGQPVAGWRLTYWCESRPQEGGRTTLLRRDGDGQRRRGDTLAFQSPDPNSGIWGRCLRRPRRRRARHQLRRPAGLAAGRGAIAAPDARERRPASLWRSCARSPHGRVIAVREDHRAPGEPRRRWWRCRSTGRSTKAFSWPRATTSSPIHDPAPMVVGSHGSPGTIRPCPGTERRSG